MRPGFAVSLLVVAGLLLTPACVWGQSTTAAPSKAPVTPPPPTYPAATAVVPTLRTYADALAFSRRWKNSTLLVIQDAASNAVARAELVDSGVLRAWLGASLSDAEGVGFVWLDGVPVGGTQRPYTNWAPGRPKSGLTNTAIAMDEASGYWFDVQQASPQPALVSILAREVTQTLPLPEYSFKPASPPTLRTPPWQTAIIIVCTLLILPLVGGTIGLIVWHIRTPFDNKDGFVAAPPADEPPPPLPPLLAKETADGIGGKRQHVHEIYRFDDPKKIEETRMQLGQPFKLPELPPEPTSQAPPAVAPAAVAASENKPNDAAVPASGDAPAGAVATANPGTTIATPADGAAVVSKAPDGAAAPAAHPADGNAAAPAEEATPPPAAAEANDEAAEQTNADADEGGDAYQAQEEVVVDAAPVAQVPPAAAAAAKLSLPPPPVARKLPAATPLGAPPAAAAPAARKLPAASPIGIGAAPVAAARTLPGSKAIGQQSAAAAPKRPGPPVGAAPKGPQPIPIAKGPAAGAKGPVGMPGPSSPPKAPMGGKVGGAAPKAKSAAPSALPTAKTARTLPPARRL